MTLHYERVLAQERTEDFLGRLLDPHKTPRVPSVIREEARRCLRHLATAGEIERPELLGKEHP